MLTEILLGVILIVSGIYIYFTRNYDYWKKKGVVFIKPKIPYGLLQDQQQGKVDVGTVMNSYYTQYKNQGLKYVGGFVLRQPTLLLMDLDLCKQVLTKDFNHFVSRQLNPTTHEFITKHLIALDGQEWREMRTKLTPVFTSGKIKNMFTLMEKCGANLEEHIDTVVLKNEDFEVKDLIVRFTTDIIATCAFGLEVNSVKDRENEFYKTGQLVFKQRPYIPQILLMHKVFPFLARLLKLNVFHPGISQMLYRIVKDTIEYRKQNNISRNDLIDLLLKVKENKSAENGEDWSAKNGNEGNSHKPSKNDPKNQGLTLEEMTAQAFAFFAAGFETASSTTTFCLYELVMNPDVQEKLRREIDEVLANNGGKITYQALQEMTYMDQVLNETLRMYASLPLLTRVCTERYQFPDTDLIIDKDVRVHIPTYAIHHDPDIYPDPYKFDPDRFTEENSKDRHNYAFLPFGEGPRICIGMRFGKLQVKVSLATILSKYELSAAADTPPKMELEPRAFLTTPKENFSLKMKKRSKV